MGHLPFGQGSSMVEGGFLQASGCCSVCSTSVCGTRITVLQTFLQGPQWTLLLSCPIHLCIFHA